MPCKYCIDSNTNRPDFLAVGINKLIVERKPMVLASINYGIHTCLPRSLVSEGRRRGVLVETAQRSGISLAAPATPCQPSTALVKRQSLVDTESQLPPCLSFRGIRYTMHDNWLAIPRPEDMC